MSFPVARIGSLTKKGDMIVSGVPNHLVAGGGSSAVTVEFDGQVLVFAAEDTTIFGDDDPEGSGDRVKDPNAPDVGPPDGGTVAPDGNYVGPSPDPVTCGDVTGTVTGNFQLSPHFTLAKLSTSTPAGSHRLQAQGGRSIAQLICNLRALATNCLEPIYTQYAGKIVINSGFRQGAGTGSQHQKGMAADIFFPGKDSQQMYEAAIWIRDHIPFDQMILERSARTGTRWIHVSFNREISRQRHKITTCGNAGAANEVYENGIRKV